MSSSEVEVLTPGHCLVLGGHAPSVWKQEEKIIPTLLGHSLTSGINPLLGY